MSTKFQNLIEAAQKIVDSYNEAPGVEKIDFEAFKAGLTKLGGTDEEALKEIEWTDLEKLGLPKLQSKKLVKIFQQEDPKQVETKVKRISKFNAYDSDAAELVAVYNSRRPTTPAAEEMKKRSKDQPFVVFDENGGVHRLLTTQLLRELESGDEPRDDIDVNGHPTKVYRVGELPPETVDMHPLYEGQPLRGDGTCRQKLDWKQGISLAIRQLVYLAVHDTGELVVRDADHVHDIHGMMKGEGAMQTLQQRYRKAAMRYEELRRENDLPSLRVPKGKNGSQRENHPFHRRGAGHYES